MEGPRSRRLPHSLKVVARWDSLGSLITSRNKITHGKTLRVLSYKTMPGLSLDLDRIDAVSYRLSGAAQLLNAAIPTLTSYTAVHFSV